MIAARRPIGLACAFLLAKVALVALEHVDGGHVSLASIAWLFEDVLALVAFAPFELLAWRGVSSRSDPGRAPGTRRRAPPSGLPRNAAVTLIRTFAARARRPDETAYALSKTTPSLASCDPRAWSLRQRAATAK